RYARGRASGEMGRRVSFRSSCSTECEGSSPSSPTKKRVYAGAHPTSPIELVLEVTTPPAGWSPWPAARAHWGRWGGLLEASFRTTSLNATCGGLCVAATFQLTRAEQ